MGSQRLRSWLNPFCRRRPLVNQRPPSARLSLERFEDRTVPSASIPLNSTSWTPIGPSPITQSQAPGSPTSTGRLNGIAVDPTNTSVMYVAADSGGIWRTTDGGATWSPRTDQQQTDFQTIAMVHRAAGNTVYAFAQDGTMFTSTDGATTFTTSTPFEANSVVNKLRVVVVNPADQTKDILYAAVGSEFGLPPGFGAPGLIAGSGIWRSTNGGATWTNIVDSTKSPFTANPLNPVGPDLLSFTDVVVDPTNANVLYAAIGNDNGDPTNGVYRTSNALSATPTWTLLIGGSAFVPGETPGNIKLAIAPSLPSVVFASLALRADPQNGFVPLLGVFRTTDAGANWAPVLIANPNDPVNDPLNFMSINGDDNNVVEVLPNGSTNPAQLTVFLGGFGANNNPTISLNNTVLISTNGGGSWTPIGIGANGVGTYPNVHDGGFDSQNRLILATGGGVYRLDSTTTISWESLNGTVGPQGLDAVQFNGFALNPTNADQAVGNITFSGDVAPNDGPAIHNAVLFSDPGTGAAAYGWQTVDANVLDGNVGSGQVIYNPFNPLIVYRVTTGSGGKATIRQSLDGGLTWAAAVNGFQGYPNVDNGPRYIPPLAIDPSQPNRLFGGYNQVQVTDDNAASWSQSMQVTVSGGKTLIPDLPSTGVTNAKGGVVGLTAIGVGRLSGVNAGINGVSLFVGTEADAVRDAMGNPTDTRTGLVDPQLYVNLIPTNSFPWPPPMTNWNNHSWAKITPADPMSGASLLTGDVEQILVDPTNNGTIYIYTNSGQVFRGTDFSLSETIDANKNIVWVPTINWTDLSGNLPPSATFSARPQNLALDPQVFTDPTDDTLYAGTGNGVWKLTNPSQDFSVNPPVWEQVGLDNSTNPPTPSLPIVPVSVISLNTSTGILAAATYGRGVYEIQVRGLITGHVFTDTNGNGVLDTGEPAIAGVTVEVLDENAGGAIVAVTTTDATGLYQFRSLTAGDYDVVALPSGNLIQTTTPPHFVGFTEQSTTTADFGFFKAGSISGTKFNDLNDNGVKDASEPGVAGFTIFIDSNNNGVLDAGEISTTSAGNGTWTFNNLGPAVIAGVANPVTFNGTYVIREAPKAGWVQTTPLLPAIALTSGQALTGELIGNTRTATISGTVFIDTNGDGVRQAGEPGEAGVTVQEVGPGGARTVVTAADGTYTFFSLAPGTYTLTETAPAGFVQTTPNPAAITIGVADQVTGVDFGNFKKVTISGTKFNDINGNGAFNTGEPGLAGFVFDLIDATTKAIVATATSTATGAFSFANIGPLPGGGTYQITEEPKTGWTQTTPNPAAFSPTSGAALSGFQFGNFMAFSISGTAYLDLNGNSAQDPGESGAPGFVIQLRSGNTAVATTTSAADGTFSITGVGPGSYTLVELPRTGFTISQGANGYAISGTSNGSVTGENFGNVNRSIIVASKDAGGLPTVSIRDAATQAVIRTFNAYSTSFTGGVRVATGLFAGGQSLPDVVTAPGPGGGPDIRVFDSSSGAKIAEFLAYTPSFLGGVYVAVGDVNHDGVPDIITGADAGGGPHVEVFDGASVMSGKPNLLYSFFAYGAAFHGGVRVAAADVNNDGYADIITGAGPGGGPHVQVFSGLTGKIIRSFFAYASNFTGGVYVAGGDVNGDGFADIITGPGLGGGPHLRVFDGASNGALLEETYAFPPTTSGGQIQGNKIWKSGLRVGVIDLNQDGRADIIVGPGAGQSPQFKVLDSLTFTNLLPASQENVFDPSFLGGIFVAGD